MTSLGGTVGNVTASAGGNQHGTLCALFFGCFGGSSNLVYNETGDKGQETSGSKAILIGLVMTSLVCFILFTVAFIAWISIRIRNRRRARQAAEAGPAEKTDEPLPDLMIPVIVVQPDSHCVVAYELDEDSQPVVTQQQQLQQVEGSDNAQGSGGCTADGTENMASGRRSSSSSSGSSSNGGDGNASTDAATGEQHYRPRPAQGEGRSAAAPRQAVPMISVEIVH